MYDKDSLLVMGVLMDPEKVREAIAAGADVNARDRMGWTPLHLVLNLQTAITLLEAGADWTLRDNKGLTAAEYSRQEEFEDVAEVIDGWVVARERAESLNERLNEVEEQQGPAL